MANSNTPFSSLTNGPTSYPGGAPSPFVSPAYNPWNDTPCGQLWKHREIRQDCSLLAKQKPSWLSDCPSGGGGGGMSGGNMSNPDYHMWGDDWQTCYGVVQDRTAHPLDFLMLWLRQCTALDNGPNYWPLAVVTESVNSPAENVEPLIYVAIGEDGVWGPEKPIAWVTNGVMASWYDTSVQRMWGMRLPGEDYEVLCGTLKVTIPAKSAKLIGCPFNTENLTLDWAFSRAITNDGTYMHVDGILPGGTVFLTLLQDDSTTAHWVPFQYVNTEDPSVQQWFPEGANEVATFVAGSGGIIVNPLNETLEFELAGYVFRESWQQPIPEGWSVVSVLNGIPGYMVTDLGFPYDNATVVRLLNSSSEWDQYTVTNGVWSPSEPFLNWGEAAMVYQASAKEWTQYGSDTRSPALSAVRVDALTMHLYGADLSVGETYVIEEASALDGDWQTYDDFVADDDSGYLGSIDISSASPHFFRLYDATGKYSVAVGAYGVSLDAGSTKAVANQLDNNSAATIADVIPYAPSGATFLRRENGAWTTNTFNGSSWSDGSMSLAPGEGGLLKNPSGSSYIFRFTGSALADGQHPASHPVNVLTSDCVRGPIVPLTAYFTEMGYVPTDEDIFYRYANGSWSITYAYEDESWSLVPPSVQVGEAFWFGGTANTWVFDGVFSAP